MKGGLRVREEEIKDWDNKPKGEVEFSILPLTECPSIVMLHQPCSTTVTDTKSPGLVDSRPPSVSEFFFEAFGRPRKYPNSVVDTEFCAINVSKNPENPVFDFVEYAIPTTASRRSVPGTPNTCIFPAVKPSKATLSVYTGPFTVKLLAQPTVSLWCKGVPFSAKPAIPVVENQIFSEPTIVVV